VGKFNVLPMRGHGRGASLAGLGLILFPALDVGRENLEVRTPDPGHDQQALQAIGPVLSKRSSTRRALDVSLGDPVNLLSVPTVLVLGAGASKPFGFPLGSGLKGELLKQVNGNQTQNTLRKLGFDNALLDLFRGALQYGTHQTVDILLERKSNLRELGSYLIATALIPLEHNEALFPQRDWYGDLFDLLQMEDEACTADKLAIVTLNYDRSFEHFLTMNIEYNCRHERVDFAHQNRKKIRVVHAHGCLGEYPSVPYGIDMSNPDAIRSAAEKIKIVSDRLDNSPDFQAAKTLIQQAKQVIFLGFGYNETTLSALLSEAPIHEIKFYGTAMHLDPKDRDRIKTLFDNDIILGDGKQDSVTFLRTIGAFPG